MQYFWALKESGVVAGPFVSEQAALDNAKLIVIGTNVEVRIYDMIELVKTIIIN